VTPHFIEEYSKTLHERITGIGTSFRFIVDDLEEVFIRNGYRRTDKISNVESAVDFWSIMIPRSFFGNLTAHPG
jgi:hypothetical protein